MWGDDDQAVKDLMVSSSSSRVRERALKEFLMTMEVAGDGCTCQGWHCWS